MSLDPGPWQWDTIKLKLTFCQLDICTDCWKTKLLYEYFTRANGIDVFNQGGLLLEAMATKDCCWFSVFQCMIGTV